MIMKEETKNTETLITRILKAVKELELPKACAYAINR